MSTAVSLPNICRTAAFDRDMRDLLLECCALDWSRISPAIFGALFQSVMDQQKRRNLGAHYTSEKNILKLIKPLFLDELRAEFDKVKNQQKRLFEFHQEPGQPEISRSRLRLRQLSGHRLPRTAAAGTGYPARLAPATAPTARRASEILFNVDQFYGIEIEEFPAQIAQVALWLMDHQMNLQVSEEFGQYFGRLPLEKVRRHRPRQRPATGLAGDRAARRN